MSEHQDPQILVGCEECGLVVELPVLNDGQKASCPRCGHVLAKQISQPLQRPLAYGVACLIMLVLSISFPFMSFSVQGITQEITLLHAAEMLSIFKNSLLAALLLLTVVILPAIYILTVLYLYWNAKKLASLPKPLTITPFEKRLCRGMFRIEPWLMVDVFLIGVLVSLIKIASLADVGLGMSFWAFCIYTLLVVKCVSMVDRTWLWLQFMPMYVFPDIKEGDSHHSVNHVSCHICSQLNPMPDSHHARCVRCHGVLHPYSPQQSLQRSWALLIASAVFFVPANLYPMMFTVSLGNSEGSTIIGGVVLLWNLGSYPIAAVIFLASVVIPLAKIFALSWLYINAHRASDERQAIQRLRLYRMTELIGRWSMIDIFVVAILVALVQLQNLMAIFPGPAALSFACVVILTMLSAMTFDPRIFWADSESSAPSELEGIKQQK
ncbi:paraquat-inducible protein A [Photobacterium sp. SDRW27]|uniref:paraquat-inducible protein A n=1 Tax=Photobacterium obscurum TaxID=2829490 RepID=UPI002243239F|nr:paraquat-inducible protein A [Photobacterium obscurum]MCW8330222.1 paraquat-inducible protein A [Photobacterium obscurum]